MYTQSEAIKEIREIAKDNGLTFKRGNITINGKPSYRFCERGTDNVVLDNQLFWTAYENCMNGCIEKITGNTPAPAVTITCEEYEICGERRWLVEEDGVGGFLDADELVGVLGAERAEMVINNEPCDYQW
jgi:hypothetical protein